MIYGLNFNGSEIPAPLRKQFAARLRRVNGKLQRAGDQHTALYVLQGVCTTEAEYHRMILQANNGHRAFHRVERAGWIGLYVGWKG
jgi:hypothetical protein